MFDYCIFSASCMDPVCDRSCPTFVQTTFLLDQNEIELQNKCFRSGYEAVNKALRIIDKAEKNRLVIIEAANTVNAADLYTYCGICKHWKNSRCHTVVYNLRLSKYFKLEKDKYDNKARPQDPRKDPEYMSIWAEKAKLLVISAFDYVDFTTRNCEFFLNLIQERNKEGFATIIVCPVGRKITGYPSELLGKLQDLLKEK